MPEAKQMPGTPFNQVENTPVFVYALKEAYVDYAGSMDLLEQHGLRPLTRREALVLIDMYPGLKNELKDTMFHLAGEEPEEEGYYTFDERGKLTKIEKGGADVEKSVYVYPGTNPELLIVLPDSVAYIGAFEARFDLNSYNGDQFVSYDSHADAVVGVEIGYDVFAQRMEETEAPEVKGITKRSE
jgi:hypothetical protein